jgi:hypothetical protein
MKKEKYCIKSGKKFGRLTVISYTDREGKKGEYKCMCDCGNITYARTFIFSLLTFSISVRNYG